ncbi:MAG TPA: TIGR03621 family F420-dependent LLM class oxidoreductase [Ktedonosporobacter sp.]|nr:TIGR03621 family F420-dependent LLM class oxidoreductase [Ktedonosporobacter sp.]
MNTPKPFRFAVSTLNAVSKEEWVTKARRTEQLGYSTLVIPDHPSKLFAPVPALLAAADATTTLRVGSFVFNNDFRHPVMLAKEAATLDVLSDGRFEFGLGAGWQRPEYEQCGVKYDPAPVRTRRLEEAIQVVKRLFAEEPANFSGNFYTINNLDGFPKPLQQPYPPLLIGGAGKQTLSLAAREASIVGLVLKALPDGSNLDLTDGTSAATMQKIQWIRQAAGERFDDLELNILIFAAIVSEDHSQAIQRIAQRLKTTEEQVAENSHCLIGTVNQICETLQERREKYGISYITIFEQNLETFAPVVARLTGT